MGIENRHIFALAVAPIACRGGDRRRVFIAVHDRLIRFLGAFDVGFEAVIMGGLGGLWGTLAGKFFWTGASDGESESRRWSPFTAGHIAFLLVLFVRRRFITRCAL